MEDNQIYLIKSGVDSFIEVTGTKLFSKSGNFGFHNSNPSMDVEISGDLNVIGDMYRSGVLVDKNSQSFTTSILSGSKNYEISFPAEFDETPAIAVTLEIEDSSPIIPYVVSGVSTRSYYINFASPIPSDTYRINTIFGGAGSFSGYHLDALSVLPPDFGGKWDTTGENICFTGGNVGIGTSDPSVELDVYGSVNVSSSLTIGGDLNVNGNTTTVNSTTITVDDKNLELAASTPPTDVGADGGGIILKGSTDKSILWDSANNKWNFNLGLTASDSVGIGTTNPGGDLEILGSTSDANFIIGGSPGDPANPEPWRIQAEGDFLHIGQNKSSFAKYLTFRGSSVGIGTTTPSSRLEVFHTTQTGRTSKATLLTLKAEYSGTDGKPYKGFGGGIEFRNEGYGNTLGPDSNGNNPGDIGYVATFIKTYLPSAAIHGGLGDLSTSTDGGHISFSVQESVDLINDQNGVAPGFPGYLRTYASSENQPEPVEKVRITHDGKVGIGTSIPEAPFVVSNGSIGIEMGYSVGGGVNYIQSYDRGSSAFAKLNLNNSITIDEATHVGIGTTSPAAGLDVVRHSNTDITARFENGGGSAPAVVHIIEEAASSGHVGLFVGKSDRSSATLITKANQVGIGTTSPNTTEALSIGDSTTQNAPYIGLSRDPTGGYWAGIRFYQGALATSTINEDSDGNIILRTNGAVELKHSLSVTPTHDVYIGLRDSTTTADNHLYYIKSAPYKWTGANSTTTDIAAIGMGSEDGTGSDDGIITFNTAQNVNTGGSLVERARFRSNGTLKLTGAIEDYDSNTLLIKKLPTSPTWTHSNGSAQTRKPFCITGGLDRANGGALGTVDRRAPKASDFPTGALSFSFTSWGLNNTSPYADILVLNSYTDSSGGGTNAMIFSKVSSAVQLSNTTFNSNTLFSAGSRATFDLTSASDQSVKENINEIEQALPKINLLRPVTFEWSDEYIQSGLSKNDAENIFNEESERIMPEEKVTNVGLIAQEVEEVIPTVVHDDRISLNGTEDGLKNIDYEKLIPHMIKAIQELSQKVEELENK